MTVTIGTGAGAREAIEIHIGTAAGARKVQEGWIGTASGKRQFYSATLALGVTASPDYIYWQTVTPASYYISSGSATATASGGRPPYRYAWQTDTGSATIDDPTSDVTGFQSSDGYSATATCTVTDDDDNVAESNPVSLL
jgi:hypothetical protein